MLVEIILKQFEKRMKFCGFINISNKTQNHVAKELIFS